MAVSPPDLENSGGFKSRLAGKKYFWWTPNFWRISGGFDQFCMVFFLSGGFWRFKSLCKQKKLFSHFFFQIKNSSQKIFLCKMKKKKKKFPWPLLR
jgi:hypothetical protein